jgi:uncharacterized membrane protein
MVPVGSPEEGSPTGGAARPVDPSAPPPSGQRDEADGSEFDEPEVETGGLVLVGPVPIFLGSWRRDPPIPYWVAALIGAGLVVAVFVLFAFVL